MWWLVRRSCVVAVACIPLTAAQLVYAAWQYGEFLCKASSYLQGTVTRRPALGSLAVAKNKCAYGTVLFCSVLFFSRPRSEGWPNSGRVKTVKVAHTRLPSVGFRS